MTRDSTTPAIARADLFCLGLVLLGIALRLVWVGDMEWKRDEQWMFHHAQAAARQGEWPPLGMDSGVGIANPALSVWVFGALSFFTDSPTGLARAVQVLNVIALLGFLLLAYRWAEPGQRGIWLRGLALAAVSPLAVLFARKIWAQDVLPLLALVIVGASRCRHTCWGAFTWGLVGAAIGQIHMSGFFYAFGLVLFTLIHDTTQRRPVRWRYWLAGSAIGVLPLIPWIAYLIAAPHRSHDYDAHELGFYVNWLQDCLGIGIHYSLGTGFWDFIRHPHVGGRPTYGLGLLHAFLGGVGLYVGVRAVAWLWHAVARIRTHTLLRDLPFLDFYLFAILFGMGITMTLTGISVWPHYLVVVFPFSYLWLAKMLHGHRRLFTTVLVAQCAITIAFLVYVHVHQGVEAGDYGRTYRWQIENGSWPPPALGDPHR
jgi:hypothetical protein